MVLIDHSTPSGIASQNTSWRRRVLVLAMRRLLEEIAEAAYRADGDAGRLELAAQPVHVDLDRVGADLLVPAVELLGELLLVDDAPAAQHQHFQHAELARRQVERLAVQSGAAPGGVEVQRAVRQRGPAARMAA